MLHVPEQPSALISPLREPPTCDDARDVTRESPAGWLDPYLEPQVCDLRDLPEAAADAVLLAGTLLLLSLEQANN